MRVGNLVSANRLTGHRLALAAAAAGALAFGAACANPTLRAQQAGPSSAQISQDEMQGPAPTPVQPSWGRG